MKKAKPFGKPHTKLGEKLSTKIFQTASVSASHSTFRGSITIRKVDYITIDSDIMTLVSDDSSVRIRLDYWVVKTCTDIRQTLSNGLIHLD
ncbi:hypothetical protein AKG43_11675 [Neisseria sp. 74A18]|nr:hypothetical protein AKG43_11675 [Neisseria sp. 74A18]